MGEADLVTDKPSGAGQERRNSVRCLRGRGLCEILSTEGEDLQPQKAASLARTSAETANEPTKGRPECLGEVGGQVRDRAKRKSAPFEK